MQPKGLLLGKRCLSVREANELCFALAFSRFGMLTSRDHPLRPPSMVWVTARFMGVCLDGSCVGVGYAFCWVSGLIGG